METRLDEVDARRQALGGRQPENRQALLRKHGGTPLTEAAVQRGLEWLVQQQRENGSWSLTGPYPNGAPTENAIAATGMALLAFQGAGNTHQAGKWQANVARGWEWLPSEQTAEGEFYRAGGFNHRFYTLLRELPPPV